MDTKLVKILLTRYHQLGGLRLIREYARMGLLLPAAKKALHSPFNRNVYISIYHDLARGVEPVLFNRYAPMMVEKKKFYAAQHHEHPRSKLVWFCWLQGLENAPRIVKACYNSLKAHLSDREIKVIDNGNWHKYIELPEYVLTKWKKKQIPPAQFSDLIRVQLLIKYGGTWIDSTVLCTGFKGSNIQEFKEYLDTDLFMFQYTHPKGGQWAGISNWFITSCSNNEVLLVLRDMLFEYWKDYDYTLSYYIFHLFFSMLREVYPDQIAAMPYGYSGNSLVLGHHWRESFKQENWDKLTSYVSFHKLVHNVKKEVMEGNGSYYNYIINKYLDA